ncbi:MAG: hypothetical protein HY301_10340 [Verrucomicrobia bacterium]|nr:hypothetical protein [Verrucomicrobiota bacterium]
MACSSSSGGISWWFEFSLQASIIPTGDDTDLTITMFVSPPGTQLTKQLTLKSTGTGEVGFDVEHENPFTFDISPGVRDIRVFGLQASDTINGTEIQAILGSSQQSGPICQTLKLSVFKAVIKEFDVIINEATLDEAIGNKVSLLGTTQPPGISIDSVDWIVEGPTIKGIERTAAAGRNVPLEEADLTNPNLGFYWVTGRQTYRVSLDITVGQTVRSAFANFRVAAPNPLLSLQGGIVQVNELNWGKPDPQYALHCGNTLGPDAIRALRRLYA